MKRPKKYYLLWKGVETGPYDAAEISRMAKFGRIGPMHKIRKEGSSEYVGARDFRPESEGGLAKCGLLNSEKFEGLLYVLAGLSFVSAWLFAAYAAAALAAAAGGNSRILRATLPMALAFFACGMAFFKLLLPMLER